MEASTVAMARDGSLKRHFHRCKTILLNKRLIGSDWIMAAVNNQKFCV